MSNTEIIKIHCQQPWFDHIKQGRKTVEGRKCSPKYQNLNSGDKLKFYCDDGEFIASAVKVEQYSSLESYLETEGVENALPGIASMEEAINVYLGFNSREVIESSGGFLGFHISVDSKY